MVHIHPAGDHCSNKHIFPVIEVGINEGVHLSVSSCLITGKQVVQDPGQVYLSGEEERKGARTRCSRRPGKHKGSGGLHFAERKKTEIGSDLQLKANTEDQRILRQRGAFLVS